MTVELTHYTKNPILEIEKAASICYDSEPNGDGKIANHCYSSGHQSVFEHVIFSFKISGVSRALTHQLVRHRMASYSQRSQRYCSEDGFDYVVPNSIKNNEKASRAYKKLMWDISKAYANLQDLGISNEDARYVLPNACCTEIQVTMNGRELIHFCNERMCCYDDKTEVLTSNGWKFFKDVQKDDLLYTLNPLTHKAEYSKIKNNFIYFYNGEMVGVKSQSSDLLVTPNHNIYGCFTYDNKMKNNNWKLFRADENDFHNRILVKKDCLDVEGINADTITLKGLTVTRHNQYGSYEREIPSRKVPIKEFLQFLGFYLSDGNVSKSGRHFNIYLTKNKEKIDKYAKILSLLSPNSPQITQDKRGNDKWQLSLHDRVLYEYLKPLGKAKRKYIPKDIFKYNKFILQYLYEGFKDGDMKSDETSYSTISKQLADDFQRLLLHIGYSGSLSVINRVGQSGGLINGRRIVHKNPEYRVSINKTKNTPIIKDFNRNAFYKTKYKGYIYCVEACKNNIIYVRRNGYTCWSGNSCAQWEIRQLANNMKKCIENELDCAEFAKYLVPKCEAGKIKYCPEAKSRSCGRQKTALELLPPQTQNGV